MAPQTQRANILQVALPATLGHRHNVIRIPQASPRPSPQSPVLQQFRSPRSSRMPQLPFRRRRIYPAASANSPIPFEHLISNIARLCPQLPLVHAIRRAERVPPRRHLQRAPAADPPSIRPERPSFPIDPTALHHPPQTHVSVLNSPSSVHTAHQPPAHQIRHPRTFRNAGILKKYPLAPPFRPCHSGFITVAVVCTRTGAPGFREAEFDPAGPEEMGTLG